MLMLFPEYAYVDTAFSGYYSRTEPGKQNSIKSLERSALELTALGLGTKHLANCFYGLFRYPKQIISHCDTQPLLRWTGEYFADFIPLDFDNKTDPISALYSCSEALSIITQGESTPPSLVLQTTGHKGFCLLLPIVWTGAEPHARLAEIMRRFVQLLLPDVPVDLSNFEPARLYRLPCTWNQPIDPEDTFPSGYKLNLTLTEFNALGQGELDLFEFWKTNNGRGVSHDELIREWFWQDQQNPFMAGLWQQAKQEIESQPKPDPAQFVADPGENRDLPVCMSRAMKLIASGDPEDKLQGKRHHLMFQVAAYYWQQMRQTPEVWAAYLHRLNQKFIHRQLPENELRQILSDIAQGKGAFSCGKETARMREWCDGGALCGRNWTAKQSVFEPSKEMPQEDVNGKLKLLDLGGLYDATIDYVKRGPGWFRFGVPRLDQTTGGLHNRTLVVIQSYPKIGKTTLLNQIFQTNLPELKRRGELGVYLSGEEELPAIGSYLMMQRTGESWSNLRKNIASGQAYPLLEAWYQDYRDTALITDIAGITTSEIDKRLQQIIKLKGGKKIGALFLDNVTFVQPSVVKHGMPYAQQVASDLKDLLDKYSCVLCLTVHLPKDEGKSRRKSKKYENKKLSDIPPDIMGAMGTSYYGNLATVLCSLYTNSDYGWRTVMLDVTALRLFQDEKFIIKHPIPLVRHRSRSLFTIEHALEIGREHFPGVDLDALQLLEEQGEEMETQSFTTALDTI